MNAAETYDVLVLGGGTAGKLAGWFMAKEGRRTAVIDRKYVGGSCPSRYKTFSFEKIQTFVGLPEIG